AVCARFLRTQQRAESQCRKMHYPRSRALDGLSALGLLILEWLVVCCSVADSFEIFSGFKSV
ncbi:hypothetical protein AB0I34_43875, partial [Kribbella sp. NPDC050281]|uniref:hypothetical protein n=1 Tax=Kribbella sp. NPDC050281 TaxID=3155515 RepID=UPI0033F50D80